MARKFVPLFVLLLFLLSPHMSDGVKGQDLEQCAYVDNFPRKEPLPDNIRERLITLCIEERKKEYEELLTRSENVVRLSREIEESYAENNELSSADRDKLKEAEDLLDKIRKELNADDDGDEDEKKKSPSTLDAIKDLRAKSLELLEEVKKTSRHTISAAAIQTSNAVMKLIKFLRNSD